MHAWMQTLIYIYKLSIFAYVLYFSWKEHLFLQIKVLGSAKGYLISFSMNKFALFQGFYNQMAIRKFADSSRIFCSNQARCMVNSFAELSACTLACGCLTKQKQTTFFTWIICKTRSKIKRHFLHFKIHGWNF